MNTIKVSDLRFVSGEFVKNTEMSRYIYGNGGSISNKEQNMIFDYHGDEFAVFYKLNADADIVLEEGDYFTPGCVDVNIKNVDIDIESVYINGDEISIDRQTELKLKAKVMLQEYIIKLES